MSKLRLVSRNNAPSCDGAQKKEDEVVSSWRRLWMGASALFFSYEKEPREGGGWKIHMVFSKKESAVLWDEALFRVSVIRHGLNVFTVQQGAPETGVVTGLTTEETAYHGCVWVAFAVNGSAITEYFEERSGVNLTLAVVDRDGRDYYL